MTTEKALLVSFEIYGQQFYKFIWRLLW